MNLYTATLVLSLFLLVFLTIWLFYKDKKNLEIQSSLEHLVLMQKKVIKLNEMILSNKDPSLFYNEVLTSALDMIEGAKYGSILLIDERQFVYPISYKGYDDDKMSDFRMPLKDTFAFRGNDSKIFDKTLILNDLDAIPEIPDAETKIASDHFKINSVIISPLYLNGKLHGMVSVDSNSKNSFSERDLSVLEYLRNQIELSLSKQSLYDEVLYLSRYDAMTGAYNRRYFEDLLDAEMKKAIRYEETFIVAVFDIDGLKSINDKYGHLAGDVLIRTFSDSIQKKIRDSDLFARLGGDEFATVFFNTSAECMENKLSKIQSDLSSTTISVNHFEFKCSFSYGVATFPCEAKSYDALIKLADSKMYAQKEERKKQRAINTNDN
ncbi:MAG: sensor domain-containing diguanylate cyclase [Tissierellales bacterium]|jgi:diguanylate cyclase (GGDEF)-like protein|nr:sensor domain-containing diguanylate cyclase [Tissierellales bacterium]